MAKRATRKSSGHQSAPPPHPNMRGVKIAALRALEKIEKRAGLSVTQSIELRQALLSSAIQQLQSAQPVLKPLPEQAPDLWANRSSSENPYMFLGRVYEPWLDHGLTMAHIRKLDRKLYQAFAVWHHRHGGPRQIGELKQDPIEALREAIRRSKSDGDL